MVRAEDRTGKVWDFRHVRGRAGAGCAFERGDSEGAVRQGTGIIRERAGNSQNCDFGGEGGRDIAGAKRSLTRCQLHELPEIIFDQKKERAGRNRPALKIREGESDLVHAAHAAARTTRTAASRRTLLFVFLEFGNERFGGEHQARDGSCVLQRQACDLGWIDDAHLNHGAIVASVRVVAEVLGLGLADFADHDGAFGSGVVRNLASRLFESALHDADANCFVIMQLELLDGSEATEEGSAAAGNDAFFNRSASGVHGVLNASFLFLQLGFGCRAHLDDRNAANQLGKALLEFFLVVVGSGVLDLLADLLDAAFDFGGLAAAFDDGGVVLVDDDLLGASEVFHLDVLELDAEIFGDGLAAGEGGDVFEHRFAAISEARGLDRSALQGAAELVDHQGGQRFTFDVFRDDEQRLAGLGNLLKQREKVLHGADFLFVNEDAHVFQNAFHPLRVSNEVGRQVAAVELHTFDDFQRGFHGARLFHGDDAVFADLFHGFGDDAADLLVVVGGDGADLSDHVALHVAREPLDFFHGDFHGALDAALESGRAGACGDSLNAFTEDGLREHGRGGGAVASNVAGLGSHFANHLRAHVLEGIAEFDFLGYGHAVLGDDRCAELLFDYRVAALGAEGNLHCVGESIHAA